MRRSISAVLPATGKLCGQSTSQYRQTDNRNTLVFRSLDGGASWSSFAESEQGLRTSRVNKIVVDPTNSNTIYLATDQGIFKSIDGGNTWQHLRVEAANFGVFDLTIDPVHSNNLYFTNDAFYRSQDGGNTWEKRQLIIDPPITNDPANTFLHATCMAIDPINPANIYVGARGAEYTGIFKSTNGGATFRFIKQPNTAFAYLQQIYIAPKNPSTIYFFHYSPIRDGRIYKSLDGGERNLVSIEDQIDEQINFLVDPQSPLTIYTSGREGLFKSLDGGITWAHLDRAVLVATDNFSTIYGKRGANLVKSVDGAVTFTATNFNRNFPITWF